jgi:hypothetical protein
MQVLSSTGSRGSNRWPAHSRTETEPYFIDLDGDGFGEVSITTEPPSFAPGDSLSGCRDLVFHVNERTFSLAELSGLVASLSLEVLRVETRNPLQEALYRKRFPDDPDAVRLSNWQVLEREQPGLFSGMVCLRLCRRSEREAVDLDWLRSALFG